MYPECVPFKKKALYLALTLPIVVVFILIAVYLYPLSRPAFVFYVSCFAAVMLFQSYCCAYQDCPYVGKFCPGIGGITVLSSLIALLLRKAKKSKTLFNVFATLGFLCLIIITVFPVFYLMRTSIIVGIGYIVVSVLYIVLFFRFVCPACAIRDTCPGGKSASALFGKPDQKKTDI